MAKKAYKKENEGNLIIFPRDKKQPEDYAAVFRERTDEGWDFVMMVAVDEATFPDLSQADGDDKALTMLKKIGEAIIDEGDRAMIRYFGDPDCPSIYEAEIPMEED